MPEVVESLESDDDELGDVADEDEFPARPVADESRDIEDDEG
jgi:hypothetical protein